MPARTTSRTAPAWTTLALVGALFVCGCGDEPRTASTDGASREARLREIEDASDAIERLIQARRAREAELLVRKLLAAVPAERR